MEGKLDSRSKRRQQLATESERVDSATERILPTSLPMLTKVVATRRDATRRQGGSHPMPTQIDDTQRSRNLIHTIHDL